MSFDEIRLFIVCKKAKQNIDIFHCFPTVLHQAAQCVLLYLQTDYINSESKKKKNIGFNALDVCILEVYLVIDTICLITSQEKRIIRKGKKSVIGSGDVMPEPGHWTVDIVF